MTIALIKFVANSSNKKTGAMTQVYTEKKTCPARCPYKNNGCYAGQGPCSWVWKKCSTPIEELKNLINTQATTPVIRHNVAGDIAIENTSDIDEKLVDILVDAYKTKKAYTYTHCEINEHNLAIVRKAIDNGFVINFSCETLEQVKMCQAVGVPAVLSVASISAKRVDVDGITCVKCPANKSTISCMTCGMCYKADRKFVPCFEVHGTAKGKALKAGFLIEL